MDASDGAPLAPAAPLTARRLYGRALKRHWLIYLAGIGTLLLTSMTEILVPKFIQWALDLVSGVPDAVARVPRLFAGPTPRATLGALVAALGFALILGLFGRIGWRQLLARRTHVEGRDLKVDFWDALRRQPLRVFQAYPLGDLMNRATGDWTSSRAIFGFTIVASLDMIFFVTLAVGAMLLIDWQLTLLCLAIFPVLPRIILRLARKEHDQHVVAQERLGVLSDRISQALGTLRLTRATASDALWQAELAREARGYADRRFEVLKTGWKIFPLGAFPTLVAYGILLVLGLPRIVDGRLSIGQFVAMQSYVLMLQGPLFDMGDNIAEWQKGFASLGRIAEILGLKSSLRPEPSRQPSAARAAAEAPVVVREVTYRYEPDEPAVLAGVALVVRPGESVGIQGPIGAGKTTLLKLVSGLLELEAPRAGGDVTVFGAPVGEIPRARLTELVTMVPQRSFLFAGTIRHNLELDTALGDEALWEVLAAVRLERDIRALPQGLATPIGEWGVNLSGGQKQRLALARALLRRRPLLLLDDCLSAVDAVTEEAIIGNLAAYRRPGDSQAIVWVAHRLSTLKSCDRVYRLEEGRLLEVPAADRRRRAAHRTAQSDGNEWVAAAKRDPEGVS